jgi:hypothetical protein
MRLAGEIREKQTDAGASAADGGRLRVGYVVDDLNKPKRTENRLPGHRWSNRAFPQNHAVLDPHPHHKVVKHWNHESTLLTVPIFLAQTPRHL